MAEATHYEVVVGAGVPLEGDLSIPVGAKGVVLFAHGSGSSRFSGRNRSVARALNTAGLATLLFDLLTAEEHEVDRQTGEYRFDIDLLGRRLVEAVDWMREQAATEAFTIGLFGASTGAAAALIAAAERPDAVGAVVSRGGRPDLAEAVLARVRAPTLLLVGGGDPQVLELNELAVRRLQCPHQLTVIPGATHLFEEPGKLEAVAVAARDWFLRYLSRT
jgi:putative phosphoribosyl transferase